MVVVVFVFFCCLLFLSVLCTRLLPCLLSIVHSERPPSFLAKCYLESYTGVWRVRTVDTRVRANANICVRRICVVYVYSAAYILHVVFLYLLLCGLRPFSILLWFCSSMSTLLCLFACSCPLGFFDVWCVCCVHSAGRRVNGLTAFGKCVCVPLLFPVNAVNRSAFIAVCCVCVCCVQQIIHRHVGGGGGGIQ